MALRAASVVDDGESGRWRRPGARKGTLVEAVDRLRNVDDTNEVLNTADRAIWCLSPADYVSHQGERPIAITWKLRDRLRATCTRSSGRRWRGQQHTPVNEVD